MIELCRVKKRKNGYCDIELKRGDKCESCKVCSFNKRDVMTVPAVCDIEVSAGDTVAVEMPTEPAGAGSLLIYALPILFILIGALIGLVGGVWLQAGLAAAGLAIGLAAAWLVDRIYRKKSGVLPKVLYRVDENNMQNNQGE